MFIGILFALLAVVVIGGVFANPKLRDSPSARIGGYCFGAVLAIIAVGVLLTA